MVGDRRISHRFKHEVCILGGEALDKIKVLKDAQPSGLDVFVQSTRRHLGRAGQHPRIVLPGPVVKAEINHGRYIAKCPFCTGAEMVDPDDLRFFCLSCDNAQAGGKWLPVVFPGKTRGQIEAELLKRPPANRNWLPGESVAKLKKENAENGVS